MRASPVGPFRVVEDDVVTEHVMKARFRIDGDSVPIRNGTSAMNVAAGCIVDDVRLGIDVIGIRRDDSASSHVMNDIVDPLDMV
jgi:hypothetical protein